MKKKKGKQRAQRNALFGAKGLAFIRALADHKHDTITKFR